MARPTPEPDPRAGRVRALFERIAPRYDLLNSVMSGGRHHAWRRLAVKLAAPPRDGTVLDVGCGTGDLSLELARHPLRRVVGVDLAPGMVERGLRKVARRASAERVQLGLGHALRLPFPDNTFDCALTAFTLRNVSDVSVALAEMRRVTRPGGRIVSLEITPWRGSRLSPLLRLYFHGVMPLLGALVARDREAYTYLPSSVDAFLSARELAERMEGVGLKDVRFRRLALGTITIHVGKA